MRKPRSVHPQWPLLPSANWVFNPRNNDTAVSVVMVTVFGKDASFLIYVLNVCLIWSLNHTSLLVFKPHLSLLVFKPHLSLLVFKPHLSLLVFKPHLSLLFQCGGAEALKEEKRRKEEILKSKKPKKMGLKRR